MKFESYHDYPVYEGQLGIIYETEKTIARIWAPTADKVVFRTYESGHTEEVMDRYDMEEIENGAWELTLQGDQSGKYYTFQTFIDGQAMMETAGPETKVVGVNGRRGMILDMESVNPEGWHQERRPPLKGPEDIIIYELHVRDMSMHPSSGISQKGKFLGLVEENTSNGSGTPTGLAHLKELGITHIHLLPSFDYRSIDETTLDEGRFNWGYDPVNYNVPEGSYSSDPYQGEVRIREFKTMVKKLHANGIRVILDVVYNHTGATEKSVFNQTVPGYYYRHNADGSWSDAAACGNETASERPMMRKYIIESVSHWVKEYHLDGFRFDLMGIHDIETMNLVKEELTKIDPSIFVYGEGWTAGPSPLPESERALKANAMLLKDIAVFSDDLRDGLKGSVFQGDERGFISGLGGTEESIKFGVVASTQHPQINYGQVNYSNAPYSPSPTQTINYVSCHDNRTLFDKLSISTDGDELQVKRMHKLAQTIVLTSQGVPFLHAGTDFLRSKQGVENSYNSPDSINQINWDLKSQNLDVFNYYKALIAFRKAHPAFSMTSTEMVSQHLRFLDINQSLVVGFVIDGSASNDPWRKILVIHNGNPNDVEVDIPEGDWKTVLEDFVFSHNDPQRVPGQHIHVKATSTTILFQE